MFHNRPDNTLKRSTWAIALLLLLWGSYVALSAPLAKLYCSRIGGDKGCEGRQEAVTCAGELLWKWDSRFVILSGALLGLMVMGLGAVVIAGAMRKHRSVQTKTEAPMPAGPELSPAKKMIFAAMCALLAACLLGGGLAFRHRLFLNNLHGQQTARIAAGERTPLFPCVEERVLLNLGWAQTEQNHPSSTYMQFRRAKSAEFVRIGIFGDSFVQGLEAAPGHDIATFLQELLRAAEIPNVEVINFGVCGYGMHQSHMLWETLGRHYDLDYVVFFPYSWHEERDRTFESGSDFLGGIHARYILKEGKLEMVPVVGNTRKAISELYYSFLPPWRYWRYDEKPTGFFRSLGNGQGKNPLYYRLFRKREETLNTWQLLFENVARLSPHLLVVTQDDDIQTLQGRMHLPNVQFLRSQLPPLPDLYKAPFSHDSAIGNRLKAQEVFNCLSGIINGGKGTRGKMHIARLKPASVGADRREKALPLSRCGQVSLSVSGRPIGTFVSKDGGPVSWGLYPFDFKARNCMSLLIVNRPARVQFLALPFMLEAGADVTLKCTVEGREMSYCLGRVASSGGVVGRLIPLHGQPQDYFTLKAKGLQATLELNPLQVSITAQGEVDNIEVLLGANRLFCGVQNVKRHYMNRLINIMVPRTDRVRANSFSPMPPPIYLLLRATGGQYVPPESLKGDTVPLDLTLVDKQGKAEHVPSLLEWKIEDLK